MRAPRFVSDDIIKVPELEPDAIDVTEMVQALARIRRFNSIDSKGRHAVAGFTIAQHCALGAEAFLAEGEDPLIAAAFLLHDSHNYLLTDWLTPAVEQVTDVLSDSAAHRLRNAIAGAKRDISRVIYTACGLPAPDSWPRAWQTRITRMDKRIHAVQSLHLFGEQPDGRITLPKLRGKIDLWPAMKAEERFLIMYRRLLGEPSPHRSLQ